LCREIFKTGGSCTYRARREEKRQPISQEKVSGIRPSIDGEVGNGEERLSESEPCKRRRRKLDPVQEDVIINCIRRNSQRDLRLAAPCLYTEQKSRMKNEHSVSRELRLLDRRSLVAVERRKVFQDGSR